VCCVCINSRIVPAVHADNNVLFAAAECIFDVNEISFTIGRPDFLKRLIEAQN